MKSAVEEKTIQAMTIIVNSSNPDERWNAHKALSALRALRKLYGVDDYLETKPQMQETAQASSEDDGMTHPDPRRRKVDLLRPQSPGLDVDELEPDRDEERIKEAAHTGGMIAFFLKPDDARNLSAQTDGAVDASEMHLTVVYLGEASNMSSEQTLELVEWMNYYSEIIPPIRGKVGGTAMFSKVEDNGKHAVVALYDSPDMPHLRRLMMELLSAIGIEPPREHGFIPHITLAYADVNNLPDINAEIVFEEISLVLGDKRVNFKLSGSEPLIEGKEVGDMPTRPFRG
jgi:2'-5' RNA ligase